MGQGFCFLLHIQKLFYIAMAEGINRFTSFPKHNMDHQFNPIAIAGKAKARLFQTGLKLFLQF